ncbi:MAG TPA: PSD1 and planctomycete cytochrome C domain-containing protein [Flavitalea sp.]|nr:PSD1 and planctomycete cytochrome C domain-containing protein [Flavitalea sp.]
MRKKGLWLACIFVALLFGVSCFEDSKQTASSIAKVDFNFHIKPILSDRCFKCHGPDAANRKAELRLDIEAVALAALKKNPGMFAIVPGQPEKSELVHRIFSKDPQFMMPPPQSNLSLSDEERNLLRKWIQQGAQYKKHWALIAPVKTSLPDVSKSMAGSNEIDRFVLAKLKEKGMKPSPEASKEQLIRRVAFDLTGLPPAIPMIDEYLKDPAANAYEKMVDRLLSADGYGERWANYWLDLARYGDTHGYQDDLPRVMWPWRDWVIKAFNENMPYNKFVTWQLAGDLLPQATKEQLLASAFNRNHKISQEGGIIDEEYRVEYVIDRTNTFGKAFLGISMECSRCHDHKYDPVTQKDFFSLYAFFNQVKETGFVINLATPDPWMPISKKDIEKDLPFLNAFRVLKNEKDTLRQMIMRDSPGIRKTFVLIRGAYDAPGAEVQPGVPESILPFPQKAPRNRLGLSEWLFDNRNPVTARVIVNRLWQELFGKGIVATSEDFGNQGAIPSHPELLDWLAVDLMEHGWDLKYLLKKIVMSATYRQSAVANDEQRSKDPDNIYLSRGPRFRMNAEMIRDNVLASSGLLHHEIGGPSVKPYQPDGIWDEVSVGDKSGYRGETSYIPDTGVNLYRRSLYTYWRRTIPPPAMITFDNPMKEVCEVRRTRTSTPLQALVLLNDPQILEASHVLAVKEIRNNQLPIEGKVSDAFRRITGRMPSNKEVDVMTGFYNEEVNKYSTKSQELKKILRAGQFRHPKDVDELRTAALMLTIQMIYNLDESITKS